jgi:hypothetical protein
MGTERDQQMIELTRLVEDVEAGRVTDEVAPRRRIRELVDQLDRQGNAAYDRGAAELVERARRVVD